MKANENSRIALFTGTFDPFTTGHASVVRRALPLFDHLVIAVAVSERKHTQEEISERVAAIAGQLLPPELAANANKTPVLQAMGE